MLTSERKRALRAEAHKLKPVVLIGQHGVTAAVLAEIGRALDDHELVKIRFRGSEREERVQEVARICATLAADLVGTIGHTATLYRANPERQRRAARPAVPRRDERRPAAKPRATATARPRRGRA